MAQQDLPKLPKYSDNNYRYPGDFRAKEIFLYNYVGEFIDISKITVYVNIYQSLETSFITGNLLLIDQANITSQLPIIGNEYLDFNFRTPIAAGGDEVVDAKQHKFQIYKKTSVRANQNTEAIALFFTSIEGIRNERLRVSKTMTGTYHEMVNNIIKNKEYLNSKKPFFYDATKGNFKYTFPNKRPVDAIKDLITVAEPANLETPDYLFFENNRAIQFRTLESLYRDPGDVNKPRPFVAYFDLLSAFNPSFLPNTDILGPITRPYSYKFNDSYNTLSNTRGGVFSSNLYLHDLINKNYVSNKFTYTQYYDKALHLDAPLGLDQYSGIMPPGPAELDDEYNIDDLSGGSTNKKQVDKINDSPLTRSKLQSRRKYFDDYPARVMVAPFTKANHTDFNTDGISVSSIIDQKRNMSKGLRDFFSMTIDSPGNFTYNVGDLVWCEVPKFNAAYSGSTQKVTREDKINTLLSGRYLVKEIHHQIDLIEQKHTTALTVCRNTYAQSLPNADFYQSDAKFKTKPVDPIGSGIDISTLQPLKSALDLKIPTPQVSTVEDVAAKLGVDINSTDISTRNAANSAVNAVLNSTTNRVLQNKYLAQVNSVVSERQNVLKTVISKTNLQLGGINLPVPTSIKGLKDMGLSTLSQTINNNAFVQTAKVAFKQVTSRVGSFFRGFF